jgi:glycine C-acetyltransferase
MIERIFNEKVNELKNDGLYKELPIISSKCQNRITVNGQHNVINLSSNNYLGLGQHPLVIEAAKKALDDFGVGSGAVRPIVGNNILIGELEDVIARFKNEESVTVFQSGLTANLGTIPAITDKGDLILSDELNHASIIDGIRLSKADKEVYNHSDMDDLEKILKETRESYKQVLIITDGVFSMDGDIADLPSIVRLAKKYHCMTYVDDAHGSGVLGNNGRGTVDYFGLNGQIDFIMGTLSKAIGVVGGYIASKKSVKDWLLNRARPILFSTALPPSSIAAITKSFNILEKDQTLMNQLKKNTEMLRSGLIDMGYNVVHSMTPIIPVIIGNEALASQVSKRLLEKNVFVSPIVFPTVPLGTGRLRIMVSVMLTKKDIDEALIAFYEVGVEYKLLN